MDSLDELIRKRIGRRPEGMARVRMGRGVVGNTTYGFWGACAASIGVAFALQNRPWFALAGVGGILVAYLVYLGGTYWFANKHPDRAMLGDVEWLQWYQSQQGAQNLPSIPPSPPVLDPTSNLQIEHDKSDA